MAIFISKEDILGRAESNIIGGMAPTHNFYPPQSAGGLDGANSLDKIERVLGQVSNILERVNTLRSNPLIAARADAAIAQKQAATAPQAAPVQSSAPQFTAAELEKMKPATTLRTIAPQLNEPAFDVFFIEMIGNLKTNAPPAELQKPVSSFLADFDNPIKRAVMLAMLKEAIKAKLPELIK